MASPLERYQQGIDNQKTSFIAQTSQKTWNDYLGSRSVGQTNEGNANQTSSSSADCQSCATVRERLVSAAISNQTVIWLVDVRMLHTAARSARSGNPSKSQSCGFCKLIYQQFWAWQLPKYRLLSQLCAKRILEIDASDEAVPFTHLKMIWDESLKIINEHSDSCFQETKANNSRNCQGTTCQICHPDQNARESFPDMQSLCEPCREIVQDQFSPDDIEIRLQPIVPLLLNPTVDAEGGSIPILRVLHPMARANNDATREWIWLMYTLPNDKAAAYIPSFNRASYDDERVFEQIRTWMQECTTHQKCHLRRHSTSLLPFRVLNLGNNMCVLQESPNTKGQYVALSYCWGAEQPNKLTGANIEAYKQGIDVAALPKTIQQAIKVTRMLNMDYIWIDSMCIMQDSEADKLRELSKMCEIYSNSTLTLCASAARWCTEGFFDLASIPGTSFRMPDIGINYPCALPGGSTGNVRLIERMEYRPGAEGLARRGWTFQEHFLPTRVVQFGACLSWECDEMYQRKTLTNLTGGVDAHLSFSSLFQKDDDSQFQLRRALHGLSNNRDLQVEQKERSGELNDTEILECPATDAAPTIMMSQCTCEDGTFFAIWQQALGRYTARDLSDPADKLPAFAGFAEVCSRVRADQYLAGLWRRRLIHDMMWTARPPPLSAPKPDQRRQAWRAPSWSWACIDAAIDVVGAHKRILETPFDNCPVISQLEATKILDCEVRLQDDQNPFGAVQGGYLEVKGPLIKAKLVPTPYFTRLHIEGSSMQLGNSAFEKLVSQDMFATPHLDLVVYKNPDLEGFGNEQDGWDVWCLQMREEVVRSKLTLPGRSQPGPITLMDGLVLLPTDGTLTGFRRIGVWVTDWRVVVEPYQHPFRGVQLRTIKLV